VRDDCITVHCRLPELRVREEEETEYGSQVGVGVPEGRGGVSLLWGEDCESAQQEAAGEAGHTGVGQAGVLTAEQTALSLPRMRQGVQ